MQARNVGARRNLASGRRSSVRAMEGIVEGDNLPLLRALPDGCAQMVYLDPPFNTGKPQERRTLRTVASETGDRTGFGGRRYASELLERSSYRDAFDDYLGFLEPRLRELRRILDRTRHAVPARRLPRGALLQAAARRAVRPRELPQRADLGLRLRRQAEDALAGQARHDPRLRARARRALLRRRGGGARAVHGARPGHAGEGGARQAADLGLVAHDRLPHRPREDRLPDAEAGGPAAPDGAGVVAARRPVRGPVRRLGDARRGRRQARPPLPADGQNPEAIRVMRARLAGTLAA